MKSSHLALVLSGYYSSTFANPTPVLNERDGPALPPGSVDPTPAELPSYSPTASIAPLTLSSKFQWQIYKSCPDESRAAITQAWADSKEMSDALASYKLKADYQPAMDMYMVTRSTYQKYFRDPPWDFPAQISSMSRARTPRDWQLTCSSLKEPSTSIKDCTKASRKPGMPISAYIATKIVFGSAPARKATIHRQFLSHTKMRTFSSIIGILRSVRNFTTLHGQYLSKR